MLQRGVEPREGDGYRTPYAITTLSVLRLRCYTRPDRLRGLAVTHPLMRDVSERRNVLSTLCVPPSLLVLVRRCGY